MVKEKNIRKHKRTTDEE